jgi:sugar lactone lactonase YvrE
MKSLRLVLLLAALSTPALPHPGSGIVVDRQGNVYFVDTGSGVWKIDINGNLTRLSGPAYHWMAIDADRRLLRASLPSFTLGGATVTRAGDEPGILLSSDFPIAVDRAGNLYYPWSGDGKQLKIFRLTPSGETKALTSPAFVTESGPLRWLNGLAAGPDGSLYYTDNRAVRKLGPRGELSTVAENVTIDGCDSIPGLRPDQRPYFRGLDVDPQATVYVAATGCRAVIRVTADGKTTTILRAESPWAPTGVALFGNTVFVLEYLHTDADDRKEWLPRVRKIDPDGRVLTVTSIDRR